MLVAALLTIDRTWKPPKFPSAEEWIRKLLYIYRMVYYSAIKRNTFELVLKGLIGLHRTSQLQPL